MGKGLRIVFMGTPEFAVPGLEALVKAGYEVSAVVTTPDKPAGRGRNSKPSPVKQAAVNNNLTVLQPERLKDPDFIGQLKAFNADLFVVIAFRILPAEVFTIPPLGTINLHASILPYYRGAAPIHRAIMEGEKESGLTTFLIDRKMDTGKLLLQKKSLIDKNETAGDVHDRWMYEGADLVVETVNKLAGQELEPKPQPEGNYPAAPKIEKADCMLRWDLPADKIHNQVRGLSPVPGAWCLIDGRRIKILRTAVVRPHVRLEPGELDKDPDSGYPVAGTAENGALLLIQVQLAGKKVTDGSAFLKGFPVEGKVLISPENEH